MVENQTTYFEKGIYIGLFTGMAIGAYTGHKVGLFLDDLNPASGLERVMSMGSFVGGMATIGGSFGFFSGALLGYIGDCVSDKTEEKKI
ncbi:MAG: hypothetical protein Q8Q35_02165 [Nanoarchaeota archaeon]|nr:hypothetical protein [Nanoarchaeota archaeon]